jgi:hypothetical protein
MERCRRLCRGISRVAMANDGLTNLVLASVWMALSVLYMEYGLMKNRDGCKWDR